MTVNILEKLKYLTRKDIFKFTNICHIILIICALYAAKLDIGYQIYVNGESFGVVSSAHEAENAIESAWNDMIPLKGDEYKFDSASYHLVITSRNLMVDELAMKESISNKVDGLAPSYGILIDDAVVTALESEDDAVKVMAEIRDTYLNVENADEANLSTDISVVKTRVRPETIVSVEDAMNVLSGTQNAVMTHVVKSGETFSSIALDYGINTSTLMEENPEIKPERLLIGQQIVISTPKPLISVETVETVTVTESIPYKTQEKPDSTIFKGITKVDVAGKTGEKQVEYKVYKANGRVVRKEKLSESVTREPVTEIVFAGSKVNPSAPKAAAAPAANAKATGKFSRPYYGIISSRYGMRHGKLHTGIDYAGKVGDPVKAADAGTIVSTGWGGGYGNLIKVSHGNGYETWYAHLSAINVTVGQKVSKDQQIGKVGNTGNSTGPHLHFEVRKNGSTQNPESYVR